MWDFLLLALRAVVQSWRQGKPIIRVFIVLGIAQIIIGALAALATDSGFLIRDIGRAVTGAFLGTATIIFLFIIVSQQLEQEEHKRERIEKVEERAREHPDRPQLAWDLARTKLESYLDRNLGQLRSIFWLTTFVMFIGFGFILYGLLKGYEKPDVLPVSIVSAASGVVISFIGGSFLLIYRSVMSQTRRYVSVLERINAVGMAVQVLNAISDDNKDLRNQSTAALAKQLIDLYSKAEYLAEEFK